MTFKTTQSNEFRTREERQKAIQAMFPENKIEFKHDNLLRNATNQTKTGSNTPVAEIVLIMSAILLALWAMDSLGWISVVKTLHP